MSLKSFFVGLAVALLPSKAAAQSDDIVWAQIEGLTPEEVGTRLLEGLEHRQIVEVVYRDGAMSVSGERELWLYELPTRIEPTGCARKRWSATILDEPAVSSLHLQMIRDRRRSGLEVAVTDDEPCLFADFAAIQPGITPSEGLEALRILQEFKLAERSFNCEDSAGTDFCGPEPVTRNRIRSLPAWLISRNRGGGWRFALGVRGGLATSVTIPADPSLPVEVRRRIPPPF